MIEVGDKALCVTKVFFGFPRTVAHGKALPLNIVMYLAPSASSMHVKYLLHFVFSFACDKVRWWLGIIYSV